LAAGYDRQALPFLRGGGEMGAVIRAYDWNDTPLGAPENWPSELKTAVGLMLGATQPVYIAYGPELTSLYNDGYLPIVGTKHPNGLGKPFARLWEEIWSDFEPIVEATLAGEAQHFVNLPIALGGRPDLPVGYFTFSYTALRDETGKTTGFYCAATETTEQVLANERREADATRLKQMLQQMPGFVALLTGPDHIYDYVNDAYVTIAGRRDFIGRGVREVFPELAGQGFYELLDRVYASGEPFSARALPLRLTGETDDRFIDFIYHPIRSENGAVTGIFVGGYDVTERVRAEAYLDALIRLTDRIGDLMDPDEIGFAAAEILGEMLRVSRVGYGTIDPIAETLHVQKDWTAPGVETLAGTVPLRAYGSFIDSLKRGEFISIADIDLDERTAPAAAALKARNTRSFVNVPVIEQGELVAVLYVNHGSIRDWTDEEHRLIKEVAARARSAVERSRNDRALRQLNATLEERIDERSAALRLHENIVQSDITAICAFDRDFRLIAFNKAHNDEFFRVNGFYTKLGDVFCDLFVPEQRAVMKAQMARALSGESFTVEEEFGNPEIDAPRWEIHYSPLRDAAGQVVGAFHHARDISVRLRAQAELADTQDALRHAQKMEAVGQLTGGLAHDFNNLLTGIMGNLELLQLRVASGRIEGLDRFILAAQGGGRRAAALTQRLLAFSRRQTLDPKPTDVNRLIAGMEEMIRRSVGPAIDVENVGAAGLWAANIDSGQLENAILNLCINARDAMPDGGRLTIETANKWLDERGARERDLSPGQYLSICVTDTGTGMSAATIERAFEPFFTTKPLGQGTGLGLSMIYGFARQSNGQVRIYSELGSGTTICIYLPRYLGGALPPENSQDPSAAGVSAKGEAILVVDDEVTIRHLIDEVLDGAGYTVIDAADGAAGLKVLQSDAPIDLLITDVGLPGGMNGRQVADAARAIRPGLKVLFITGYAENAAVGNGHLEAGMELLTKPFTMEALAAKVTDMLKAR
jgi:signal transduction histidine kinase